MRSIARLTTRRGVLVGSAGAAAALLSGRRALAAYPERPVSIIVPFAPAGPTDIIARILAQALSQRLGQQFVVDNRTGASGNTGLAQAARATPDGHTLLVTSTAIAVNAAVFRKIPYDPLKDFAPISELVNAPNVLVVDAKSGMRTVADLVKQAKDNPSKFNYSHPGAGTKSQLAAELLKLRAGIEMLPVPYRGAGPAVQAVLEGTVQVCSTALAAAEAMIQSGQLHPLAVTSEKRWFSLPNVPTMIEQGFKDFVSDTFNAVLAPAAVPQPILATLEKESRSAFQRDDVRQLARNAGFDVVAGTPDALMARIKKEISEVRELITRAGIPQQ
jgi:tripartite-type tricarboxylate transporter receptor subunit TctC